MQRPPRGVQKEGYASKDIHEVRFPNLSPGEVLLREATPAMIDKTWRAFKRRFLTEMKAPEAKRDLDFLAALQHHANFSIGYDCEDESRCHRSILKVLLDMRGAEIR